MPNGNRTVPTKALALALSLTLCLTLCFAPAYADDTQPSVAQTEGQSAPTPPDGQTPPAMPDGQGAPNGQTPPNMPNGQTPPDKPDGEPPQGGFGGGEVTQGAAATVLDMDANVSDSAFTSTDDNENALRVTNGATVLLQNVSVEKLGGATDSNETSDFYGQNAGLLATDGAKLTLRDCAITTSASGGNALFSYGVGTVVTAYNTVIHTSMNSSGGLHVTGGGELHAYDSVVVTEGASAASIRSDRGGGTLEVMGGSFTTNGTGSPAIYSTADVTVKGATLTANHSEAIVIEGKNSVALEDCVAIGSMDGAYGGDSSEHIHGVMIYQSMSGDATVGRGELSVTGGSISTLKGDLIYVTNTDCLISLSGVALTRANDILLTVAGNDSARGWGTAGANGGACELKAAAQILGGNIIVDSISSLDMTLSEGSAFTGAVNPEGAGGEVSVTIEEGSVWTLTADSYITSLTGDPSAVITNGYTLNIAD